MNETPKYRRGGPVPEDEDGGGSPNGGDTTSGGDETPGPGDGEDSRLAALFSRAPAAPGIAAGIAAFAITLLFTIASAFGLRERIGNQAGGEPPNIVVEATWAFYQAFGVGLRADGEEVTLPDLVGVWSFTNIGYSPIFTVGTFAAILLAGYAAAEYAGPDSIRRATTNALGVVVPYLLAAPVVASLVTWTPTPEGADVAPEAAPENVERTEVALSLTDAVLYGGLVWPTVFAVAGALLAVGRYRWVAGRRRTTTGR